MNLFPFFLERDPTSLTDLTKFGDQYSAAHPTSKVQEQVLFQAFVCEGGYEISNEEVDAYVAQTFPHNKPQLQGRLWDRQGFPQGRSTSEQRPTPLEQPSQPDSMLRYSSSFRGGCCLCGSWCHDIFTCPYKKHDDFDTVDGNRHNKEDKQAQGCFSCGGPHIQGHCRCYKQTNAAEGYTHPEPGQQPNQFRSQEARVSDTMYPVLLAIPVSATLSFGKGFVDNRLVSTLFDSGANTMAIDCRLVPRPSYTGKYVRCRTFSGRVKCFPQCRLFIRTPYYTSLVAVCTLRKPICELIVGQLKGIRNVHTKKYRCGIDVMI